MTIIYFLVAVFIAWIWVDYFRIIDLFEKEKLSTVLFTFILGCFSVFIVFGVHSFALDNFYWEMNGNFLNDFLYSVFKIGLLEEISKSVPVIIIYFLFKKQFNEPIDYVIYFSVSALGFSAIENVLYFNNHGPQIISTRAILCSLGHMYDTSLIAYAVIRYKFYKKNILEFLFFCSLSIIAHGFYDFWLMYEPAVKIGFLITIVFFLVCMSWFATIMNNALNNSPFFTHGIKINPHKITKQLFIYYGIVFVIEFVLIDFKENSIENAFGNLIYDLISNGVIIFFAVKSLSVFELKKGFWAPFELNLPFVLKPIHLFNQQKKGISDWVNFKGESVNEILIDDYIGKEITLVFLPNHDNSTKCSIIKKISLQKYEHHYLVNLKCNEGVKSFVIHAKNTGKKRINNKYPIVALLDIVDVNVYNKKMLTIKNLRYNSWSYLRF